MKRPLTVLGFAAAQALLLAVAALPAWRGRLWGVNAWTFLDVGVLVVVLTLSAAAAFLVFRPPPIPGRPVGRLALIAIAAAIFYLLRDRTHLLGDGRLWLAVLRENPVNHPHEPLAFAASWLAASTAGGRPPAVPGRLELWSVLLGLVLVVLLFQLAHRIAGHADYEGRVGQASPHDHRGAFWLAFLLLLTPGALQFAFGYVEAYPALAVAVVLFLVSSLDALEHRTSAMAPALAWGLATAIHGSAFLLFPALLVTLKGARGSASRRAVSLVVAGVPLLVAYALLPLFLPASTSSGAGLGPVTRGWSDLLSGMKPTSGGAAWILEQLNRGILTGGAALTLIGSHLVSRWSKSQPTGPSSGEGDRANDLIPVFLATVAFGLYLPALLFDMGASRGSAADWDALAVAGFPLAALAAWLWVHGRPSPATRGALAAAVGVAFFGTAAFIAVNASRPAALARFELLVDSSFRTARARSWGHETLALYRRDEGDLAGAAADYLEAVRFQPENPRLLRNAATTLSRSGRPADAAQVLAALTRVEPGNPLIWLRLGMERDAAGQSDSAIIALRQALQLDPQSLDATNELARLLLRRPEGHAEAYRLIRNSLEKNPGQQHAAEMREALRKLESEGYGALGPGTKP